MPVDLPKTPAEIPAPAAKIPSLRLLLWLLVLILLVRAAVSLPSLAETLMAGDNDDLMRLVRIRDWLGGQGWFDNQQYRMLPPEGISLHWSRYVDAGIAALLVPLSWALPMATAELVTVALWPTLLAVLLMLVVGIGTDRILGRAAAFGAVIMALTWGKLGGFEFAPGRIDHHNVQILCATLALYLSVIPGNRPALYGSLAGLATAFSLAVGLEMVPVLALIWAMAALRQAFDLPGAGRWLTGYALTIALAAPLLLAGQAAPAEWLVNHCDVLAPPILSLLAIGVVATLVPVIAAPLLPSPLARIAVVAVLTGLGVWLAAPLLLPCLAGPYADVSPEARAIIDTRITEARSIWSLLKGRPETALSTLVPVLLVLAMAMLAGWRQRRDLSPTTRLALVQMLAVALIGLLIASTQIRAMNLAAPAIPFLAGFALTAFLRLPKTNRIRPFAALLLILALPPVVDGLIIASRSLRAPGGEVAEARPRASCRSPAVMAELSALPPSVLFSSMNLGAAILAYTPQSATSAPYHRSHDAFWNGIGALESAPALQKALRTSGADYLVLCPGSSVESQMGFVGQLQAGDLPVWLLPLDPPMKNVLVLRVDKAALAPESAPEAAE